MEEEQKEEEGLREGGKFFGRWFKSVMKEEEGQRQRRWNRKGRRWRLMLKYSFTHKCLLFRCGYASL